MQRRESGVAFDLVDELRRDELVFADRRPAADGSMADGRRGREVSRVERVGNHLEGHGAIGQSRSLIDEFLARGVLDPELAQLRADAVDRALVQLAPLAVGGLIDGKLDGRRAAI